MTQQGAIKAAAGTRLMAFATGLLAVILFVPARLPAETRAGAHGSGDDTVELSPAGTRRPVGFATPDRYSATRTLAVLAAVIVGIAAALRMARRFIPGLAADQPGRAVQVLSRCPLGTKGVIYVVRCGPRVLIVGATASQLSTLAEIADPDEISELVQLGGSVGSTRQRAQAGSSPTSDLPDLKGQVDGMLEKIASWKSPS